MKRCTLTMITTAGLRVGDAAPLFMYFGEPTLAQRLQELTQFLWRPRLGIIIDVTPTTVKIEERRPTWAQWRAELWRLVSP